MQLFDTEYAREDPKKLTEVKEVIKSWAHDVENGVVNEVTVRLCLVFVVVVVVVARDTQELQAKEEEFFFRFFFFSHPSPSLSLLSLAPGG